VIAGGEIVASRAISQFVETVKADDIVKESLIKVDSDKLGAIAQEYATANNAPVSFINYALKKEGADAAPLWSLTCLDETGKQIGVLVVSATKGNVISHEGFTAEPGAEALARVETQGETEAEREERRRNPKRIFVHTTPAAATPNPGDKKDVLSRMGTSINRFFTGGKKP